MSQMDVYTLEHQEFEKGTLYLDFVKPAPGWAQPIFKMGPIGTRLVALALLLGASIMMLKNPALRSQSMAIALVGIVLNVFMRLLRPITLTVKVSKSLSDVVVTQAGLWRWQKPQNWTLKKTELSLERLSDDSLQLKTQGSTAVVLPPLSLGKGFGVRSIEDQLKGLLELSLDAPQDLR